MKTRAGIVGHSGYSGQELVRILSRHPHVEPVLLDRRDDHAVPAIRNASGPTRIPCTGEAVRNENLAVVFLGTAADVSMELAPAMLAAGARVIDLSGAFRLGTPENFTAWYKEPHTHPDLLAEAGSPVPDCFPTPAATRPLRIWRSGPSWRPASSTAPPGSSATPRAASSAPDASRPRRP